MTTSMEQLLFAALTFFAGICIAWAKQAERSGARPT